jgi:outer membrane biosynthesis protein TonB
MREPIQVNYVPDGDDWSVTVNGRGQQLTGKAPGLIAARDRADQLVEKLAPDEEHRTVVHLLNGDAVEFTTAYLTARLARSTEPAEPKPEPTTESKQPEKESKGKPAKATTAAAEAKPQPRPRPKPSPKPTADPTPQPAPRPAPEPAPAKDETPTPELNGAASPPA